jgi:hypothetical protein
VKVLLAFIFIIVVGSMWETSQDRPVRALPLAVLSTAVAVVLFTLSRFV